MGRQRRQEILQELEKHRGSKVVAYLTSNRPNAIIQMKKDILPRFANMVRTAGKHRKLDVFIFTQGGDTITAFGLARLLREFAEYIGVLVPDCCHSAGTLFALGANEIVMTRAATLSPIDPSISQPLNPAVQLNPQMPPQILPLNVESVAGYRSGRRLSHATANRNVGLATPSTASQRLALHPQNRGHPFEKSRLP